MYTKVYRVDRVVVRVRVRLFCEGEGEIEVQVYGKEGVTSMLIGVR